jgi:hypothetical protein
MCTAGNLVALSFSRTRADIFLLADRHRPRCRTLIPNHLPRRFDCLPRVESRGLHRLTVLEGVFDLQRCCSHG